MTTSAGTTYQLEGRLLEVCSCDVLCPCWVGRDPDGGTCDAAVGWHIDSGTIQGVDVSGLTIALSAHIPGNILKGNWQALLYVDDKATQEQQDALLAVFTGKLGGPIADTASLIGEVVGIERVPITFTVDKGKGTLSIGERVHAEMAPDELYFLIGADAFAEIRTWHRWRDVVRAVRFLVVGRPGSGYDTPEGAKVIAIDSGSTEPWRRELW